MKPFYSKGKLIVPEVHLAKFNGKRNASKSKTLMFLNEYSGSYFGARELHLQTGVPYNYLLARLPYWYEWRYLNRKVRSPAKGKPHWTYCIALRGSHFVFDRIPPDRYAAYLEEINQWQQQVFEKCTIIY